MNIKKLIQKAGLMQWHWMNPLFLGLIPAVVILLMKPVNFRPIEINSYTAVSDCFEWYEDMDGNGVKEKLRYGFTKYSPLYIYAYDEDENLYGQYNLEQELSKAHDPCGPETIDLDNDGVREVLVFSQSNDSLFINVFSFLKKDYLSTEVFVTKIGGVNDKTDYVYHWIGHLDANYDGFEEVYFVVSGRFALYPRRVFRYDYANDEVLASINTGAAQLNGLILKNEEDTLIVLGSQANGNASPSYPYAYHDSCSWLFFFDKDLKLRKKPMSFGHYPGAILSLIEHKGDIIFNSKSISQEQKRCGIYKMNTDMEYVDSFLVEEKNTYLKPLPFRPERYCLDYADEQDQEIYLDDFSLSSKKVYTKYNELSFFKVLDINEDGRQEAFFRDGYRSKLIILSGSEKNVFEFDATGLGADYKITYNFDINEKKVSCL